MLRFELSKIERTTERPVDPANMVTQEGQALVMSVSNGAVQGVKPSTGTSTDQFVGISFAQQITPTALPFLEALVVTSANTITTTNTPLSGYLRVVDTGTTAAPLNNVLVAGTPASNAGQYSISGNVITVNSSLVGHTIVCTYRYSPTTLQVKAIQGDIPAGGAAALLVNSVGVVEAGDVYTTEFDVNVDWTTFNPSSTPVRMASNGLLTLSGSGNAIPSMFVVGIPSTTQPFLGVHFSV